MSAWLNTHYVFEQVARRGEKNLPCPTCHVKVRRAKTFINTISPFNVDPATGIPRTREQIWARLGDLVAEWKTLPEFHVGCKP